MSQKANVKVRTRDHGFDDYMDVYKKVRNVEKFQKIILSQPNQSICIARLDTLARRHGMKMFESGGFVLKFPHIFEIFEHPVQRLLWCRLTSAALQQIEEEKAALEAQKEEAVTRLRKLLMMAAGGRVRLEHVQHMSQELGMPEDFESSIILKNPRYFRLTGEDTKYAKTKYLEIDERDPQLSLCAIEKLREQDYRERGKSEENIRFSFIVNFPPGFKISKAYRIFVFKWQRLPYWSPYEDISRHDLRSLEAHRRLEKRVVATIHEFLNLTVEKKITLEKIAHLRHSFYLPNKLKNFLLQYQGIFYISTRGNKGKLHTIFLREAYKKGELIEPNRLYLARRKLVNLIMLSPRKATYDESLVHYMKDKDDEQVTREYLERSVRLDANVSSEKIANLSQKTSERPGQVSLGHGANAFEDTQFIGRFKGDNAFEDTQSIGRLKGDNAFKDTQSIGRSKGDIDMQFSNGSRENIEEIMARRNQ